MKTTLQTRAHATLQALVLLSVAILNSAAAEASHRSGNAALSANPADCSTDSALCLQEGRFLVSATWKKPDGSSGPAHAVRLTPDSGYFWFLDPDNVEVVVKTLDGCSMNARYWFFAGGLTDLEVAITVADTVSGRSTTYSNPQGVAFRPIVDVSSLSSCPAVATTLSERSPEEPGDDDRAPVSAAPQPARRSQLDLGCTGSETALCIGGRFLVEAIWQSAAGRTGAAHAVSLTSESGYFWFFDRSNVELVVKALDACALGRGQWFFATGMTAVRVQLEVTDTFTGEIRTYTNPLGAPFLPIQDTSAFSFCPTPTATPTPTVTPTGTPTPTPTATRTPRPVRSPPPTPTPPVPTPGPGLVRAGCRSTCSFSPSTVYVAAGGAVHWFMFAQGPHSTTSGSWGAPDGNWDSGLVSSQFSHVFPRAGTFHYYCRAHGERGTIVVVP